MLKKYFFYLCRWQLSTPIFVPIFFVLEWCHINDMWLKVLIANIIGALFFFWIDRWIFGVHFHHPLWEIRDEVKCADCGAVSTGYRLVKTNNYDKLDDPKPEYRCSACSQQKLSELRHRGVKMEK
jgi:DNA-directed RNA polymerase subunit RPC12/RpoP